MRSATRDGARRRLRPSTWTNRELEGLVRVAFANLGDQLARETPALAERVRVWVTTTFSTRPETAFLAPSAFPMLYLPWWMEEALNGSPDLVFQADVVSSTICGYMHARLIDNVMDGQSPEDASLLPVLGYFHTEFQRPYTAYFPPTHQFWESFRRGQNEASQAAIRERELRRVTDRAFLGIVGRKTAAGKIPLAAVALRYGEHSALKQWTEFFEVFACWHQMLDDLRDWEDDLAAGRPSLLLTRMAASKPPAESTREWVFTVGFDLAMDRMERWMARLKMIADRLNHRPIADYLSARSNSLGDAASTG